MDVDFFNQATDVFLEVEINPNSAQRFEVRYESICGSRPVLGDGYQHQSNKWGGEFRVYFNCDADLSDEFTSIDVYVEHGARPYRSRWQYRANNQEFFWSLINAGYRLGQN